VSKAAEKHQQESGKGRRTDTKAVLEMTVIQKAADRLLTAFVPKTTASACWTCRYVSCGTNKHQYCCPNSVCQAVCGPCVKI
jgi:hypothetical protein